MLKLKTNETFPVNDKRGKLVGLFLLRLIIDKLEIDNNNIVATGYYYYFNESGQVVKLDNIRTPQLWDIVTQTEDNLLEPLVSNENLKANLLQRLNDFTFLQLALENGENYNTLYTDWVIDNN